MYLQSGNFEVDKHRLTFRKFSLSVTISTIKKGYYACPRDVISQSYPYMPVLALITCVIYRVALHCDSWKEGSLKYHLKKA